MVAVPSSAERGCPAWLDAGDFDGPGEDSWRAPVLDEAPALGLDDTCDDAYPDEDGLPVLGFGVIDAGPAMEPGVPLHMLAEHAAAGLAGMAEDEVIELIAAARRLRSRAEWLQAQATAEFAARRWDAGPAEGPQRRADGRLEFTGRAAEFAADEIAFRLTEDQGAAQEDMELSLALRDRLPRMDARLAAGEVDLHRCRIISQETSALCDEDARLADEMLAPDAGGLKYGALRRRARKIAMMLDPDCDRERKEQATRRKARVEVFPEKSGNHAFAGRELPAEEALACDAYVKGMARYLKARGVPGSLRVIEVMVYLDLNQGRDPRARIPGDHGHGSEPAGTEPGSLGADSRRASGPGPRRHDGRGDYQDDDQGDDCGPRAEGAGHDDLAATRDGDREGDDGDRAAGGDAGERREQGCGAARGWRDEDWDDPEDDPEDESDDTGGGGDGPGDGGRSGGAWPFSPPGPGKPGGRAPFPAKINLLVPAGTLLGWSTMPGEAGREIIGPQALRNLVQSASRHPATRWHVTLLGADRTAIAHGSARGQHPWNPETAGKSSAEPDSEPASRDVSRARDGTSAPALAQQAQLAELLGWLKPDLAPIATGACDHAHREDRYRPSRKLQDMVRARNATCPAPGCGASAAHSDIDHTVPWPSGDTDECNLGPPCRRHHRAKQAPGWRLTQPAPGEFRWQTPTGHVYHVSPTRYDT
jgi:hypothetical protein